MPKAKRQTGIEKAANARWPTILDQVSSSTGTKHAMAGDCIIAQVGECFVERTSADAADRVLRAVVSMEEMEASNLTESMLAGQMLTANTAAQRFLAQALVQGQTVEGVDRNVDRATRFMRVFMEQVEVMKRLKGKGGQQRVVVEHVNVHEGGQAIVGAVMGGSMAGVESPRAGNTP